MAGRSAPHRNLLAEIAVALDHHLLDRSEAEQTRKPEATQPKAATATFVATEAPLTPKTVRPQERKKLTTRIKLSAAPERPTQYKKGQDRDTRHQLCADRVRSLRAR